MMGKMQEWKEQGLKKAILIFAVIVFLGMLFVPVISYIDPDEENANAAEKADEATEGRQQEQRKAIQEALAAAEEASEQKKWAEAAQYYEEAAELSEGDAKTQYAISAEGCWENAAGQAKNPLDKIHFLEKARDVISAYEDIFKNVYFNGYTYKEHIAGLIAGTYVELGEQYEETNWPLAAWYYLQASNYYEEAGNKKKAEEYYEKSGIEALTWIGFALAAYKPYHHISNLLIRGSDFRKWQEDIDRVFARLYLGTEYVVSAICQRWFKKRPPRKYGAIETPEGIEFLASIQADRSPPMPLSCDFGCPPDAVCRDGICYIAGEPVRQYFYKITFGARAPAEHGLTFMPYVYPGKKALFTSAVNLDKGKTLTMVGEEAIVFFSDKFYDKICIQFSGRRPKDRKGTTISEICSPIVVAERSYLNYQIASETGGGTPPPTQPGLNPDL